MTDKAIQTLELLSQKLLQFQKILLVGTFLTTLLLAVAQIFLRNFFDMGIIWADSFLRISVLWLGMMGALLASHKNNHINMNLGQKFLSTKNLRLAQIVIYTFTTAICAIVAWYGINLVTMEYEDAGIAFANIPIWLTVSIIPLGFFIMALRYLTFVILLLTHHKITTDGSE